MTGWALPEEVLRNAPAHAPRPRELADLELLLSGALAPLTGLPTSEDLREIARSGHLADGTPWPLRITVGVPTAMVERLDLTNPLRRAIVLTDPEGTPLAAVDTVDAWPLKQGWSGVGGRIRRIGTSTHGSFRRLRRSPAEVRAELPPGRVLGVFVDRPLHRPQLAQIAYAARTIQGHVLVLIPVGDPGPGEPGSGIAGLSPEALIRTVFAARDRMPPATIVAVPLARRGDDITDALLRAKIAENYGATHLLASGAGLSGGGLHALLPRELAYDGRDGQWRGADDIPPRHRRVALLPEQIDDLLDRGITLPEWHTPPAVAAVLAQARPRRSQRGLVVFFTGLSGSGKSTVARGVADLINETGERTVTLIDGDVARRFLTAGLGFSKEDRDENVRRIGFVAAEAARHGGLALCCPIAPYADARAAARRLALAAGAGFILVHMSTPLAVCEERDPKGLYAKARAGQISNMTGLDDPYEVPTDAELTVDTSTMTSDEAVARVLEHLTAEGWLDRR
jgi:sulfate adenylyltransferase